VEKPLGISRWFSFAFCGFLGLLSLGAESGAVLISLYVYFQRLPDICHLPALFLHLDAAGFIFCMPFFLRYRFFIEQTAAQKRVDLSEDTLEEIKALRFQAYISEKEYQHALDKVMADKSKEHKYSVYEQALYFYPPEDRKMMQAVRYYVYLFCWLILFLPVVGLVGSCLTFFSTRKVMKRMGLVEDYQQETEYALEKPLYSDTVSLSDEISIQPALDILNSKDDDFKRGAVNILSRIGTPEAVRILKRCLSDSNPEVRFYAHSSIARLDAAHIAGIKDLETNFDFSIDALENHKRLGKAYRDYAESGLLEEDTVNHYLSLSRESFRKAYALDPEDSVTATILGQLSISEQKHDEAEKYFRKTLEAAADYPYEALLGLCQIYYETRNKDTLCEIRKGLDQFIGRTSGDVDKDILIQFWGQGIQRNG